MKIRLMGAEMFHADGLKDGQTDVKKLIVAIRKFANVPIKRESVTMFE